MKESKNKIAKSAAILGFGTFIAKLLGAIYRIPLTRILGGSGIGLYQMVFPVYTVLLDFSGAGAPNAISKIIASYKGVKKEQNAYNYLCTSLKLFSVLGLISFFIMVMLSGKFSGWQGDINAQYSYIFLAPAIFFVCLITPFRGYFQGLMDMRPTATSQVIEQAIKLMFGLLFSYLFLPNIPLAAAGAALAITLSEMVAALYLWCKYKNLKSSYNFPLVYDRHNMSVMMKNLIKTAIPITLIGIIIPLSHVADSFIIINGLNSYLDNATALFGLLSGVAMTIINLPVAICYGIATAAIPTVAASDSKKDKIRNIRKSVFLTIAFSLPCALLCYFLSPTIVNILFSSLLDGEKNIAVNLLKILSPTVVLLSLLQTQNAVLIATGKTYYPIISTSFGVLVKILLNILLISKPSINIYGSAFAVIACYFTANLLNFIKIISFRICNERKTAFNRVGNNPQ